MARANLNVSDQITETFLSAQETRDVRIVKIKIQGENLIVDGVINKLNSASEDFDSILVESLNETEASFALFCLTDDPTGNLSWVLIAWIPDGCRVRDKMLYSSSREDLKRQIGLGYFRSDYAANSRTDITWKLYQESMNKQLDEDMYTESERLLQEEKTLVAAETNASKSTALGVIPFELSPEVTDALTAFSDGQCNWVEMNLVGEKVNLITTKSVKDGESLQQFLSADQSSFLAIKLPRKSGLTVGAAQPEFLSLFVFFCPDTVLVRIKMMMSSSKASVIAAAQERGVSFDKTLEVRGVDEIDDAIKAEVDPEGVAAAAAGSGNTSSAAASISHAKPQRPGKGRAKVSKFKLEE